MPRIAMWSKLREYRKAAKMTQQQVADALGISLGAYNHYESEESTRIPKPEILGKLLRLYNLTDYSLLNPYSPIVRTVVCSEDLLSKLRSEIEEANELIDRKSASKDYDETRKQLDSLNKTMEAVISERAQYFELPDGISGYDYGSSDILRINLDRRVEKLIEDGIDAYRRLAESLIKR